VTQLSGSPNSPWKYKPCLNYCEITELYCPHLKNTDTDDYAGLPTYRCSGKQRNKINNKGQMRTALESLSYANLTI